MVVHLNDTFGGIMPSRPDGGDMVVHLNDTFGGIMLSWRHQNDNYDGPSSRYVCRHNALIKAIIMTAYLIDTFVGIMLSSKR